MGAILAMAVKIVPPTLIPCNAAERPVSAAAKGRRLNAEV